MKFIDPTQDPWHLQSTHRLRGWTEWQAEGGSFIPTRFVGLRLANDEDVFALREDLARWSLITLDFPKWTDGRAYSQARLLRTRLHYRGALRATGDVRVDMVPLLQRTGFDEVQLAPGESPQVALQALQLQPTDTLWDRWAA